MEGPYLEESLGSEYGNGDGSSCGFSVGNVNGKLEGFSLGVALEGKSGAEMVSYDGSSGDNGDSKLDYSSLTASLIG